MSLQSAKRPSLADKLNAQEAALKAEQAALQAEMTAVAKAKKKAKKITK